MKKYILILTICFLSSSIISSQNRRTGLFGFPLKGTTSIGFSSIGASNLYGDVGGAASQKELLGLTDWKMSDTQLFASIGLIHVFPNTLGFEIFASYGSFSGSDEGTRNAARDYSYETNIFDLSFQGVGTLYGGPYGRNKSRHWIYGTVGLGLIASTPTLKQFDAPISTPIYERTTSNNPDVISPPGSLILAPMVPVSIGYSYKFNYYISIGAEACYRNIFTDQLDGLHSRFSKSPFDGIASIAVTFVYKVSGGIPNELDCNCDWQ